MAEPIRWQDAWWHQQPDGSWLRFNEETQTWEPQGQAQARPVYAPSSGMSTGAKWAIGLGIAFVAFLILAILAAIAIPVFLSQREKASIAQVKSALKNAATAQSSYYMDRSVYANSISDLEAEGLEVASDVDLFIVTGHAIGFCMEATHELLPNEVWSYDNGLGRPREGPCH